MLVKYHLDSELPVANTTSAEVKSAFVICVLAGGLSSRMGRDKALLPWRGRPLLAHMIELARAAQASVTISGPRNLYGDFGVCWPDLFGRIGPLGGIGSALRQSREPKLLVLGCDLPFIDPRFLRRLWNESQAHDWTLPESSPGRIEPLCAVYSKLALPAIERAIAGRDYKIDRALAAVDQRVLTTKEIQDGGFGAGMFRNVNTAEDYERWQSEPEPAAGGK